MAGQEAETDSARAAHHLEQVAAEGVWGGPVYVYRGAEIRCLKGGHVCGLSMPGHPLDGMTFGVVGTITPLIDRWIDQGRLPDHMRAVSEQV